MNTVIIAIVMGIMYWWCRGMILSYFGFLFISSPVTVGLVAGLLMGQPMQGLIISVVVSHWYLQVFLHQERTFQQTSVWQQHALFRSRSDQE